MKTSLLITIALLMLFAGGVSFSLLSRGDYYGTSCMIGMLTWTLWMRVGDEDIDHTEREYKRWQRQVRP